MNSNAVIGDNQLELTRFFAHPREAVFAAWTDPEQLGAWWGCKDTERVTATIDCREGGAFSYTMHMKDGSEMIYGGVYTEVVEPERLVTTSEMGAGTPYAFTSTTTVEFIEQDGGTLLRLTQVGLPPMPEPGPIIAGGFTAAFDKLERQLAG